MSIMRSLRWAGIVMHHRFTRVDVFGTLPRHQRSGGRFIEFCCLSVMDTGWQTNQDS